MLFARTLLQRRLAHFEENPKVQRPVEASPRFLHHRRLNIHKGYIGMYKVGNDPAATFVLRQSRLKEHAHEASPYLSGS